MIYIRQVRMRIRKKTVVFPKYKDNNKDYVDSNTLLDDHSLELLDTLMRSKIKILVFISYRDQGITGMLGELLENGASYINFIEVTPFDMDSTLDFLCDTFHRPRDVSRDHLVPLAQIILKRTNGNSFYTMQLLQVLERKKLIFFNWQKNEWDYNLNQITDGITPNGQADTELDVSFMVARLRELPSESQNLLKWASFVGDVFSWPTVKELMLSSDALDDQQSEVGTKDNEEYNGSGMCTPIDGSGSEDTERETISVGSGTVIESSQQQKGGKPCRPPLLRTNTVVPLFSGGQRSASFMSDPIIYLQEVIQEGYIISIAPDEYRWAHDRIAQAAGELASPRTRSRIHLAIAQHLMKGKQFTS